MCLEWRVVGNLMAKTDKLLTRLLVGVIKHQAKRYLGDDVVEALIETGSEYLGEELLELLKGEASSRELAEKLLKALRSATAELERATSGAEWPLRLDDAPEDVIQTVVDTLSNLDKDFFGDRLQSAIQDLVATAGPRDTDVSLRVCFQLYQAVLMAVVTVPELQFRAQDLLQQSRIWVLVEQMRRIERVASGRHPAALPVSSLEALTDGAEGPAPSRVGQRQLPPVEAVGLEAGLRIAEDTVELVKQLGGGGFGPVWQGHVVATGEPVAVKFLDECFNQHPEVVRSFERDVYALAALAGGAVPVVVRSATFDKGRHFYVFHYAENSVSLATILQSSDVPLSRKLELLCAVAKVLHGFHKQGWIHGDVKPANILLAGGINGDVQFIDFASAQRIGESDVPETITFTYAYAAPELLKLYPAPADNTNSGPSRFMLLIKMDVRPALDVYPLGVMLFQALDPGLARIARMEEYWLIPRLVTTPNLKAVVRKALAREPKDRFKTALEFELALSGALRSATEDASSL
jgi:Protein kinase domain